MRTDQPVNNHEDLVGVVDGLLEEMGLDRRDTGGKVTFAGLDPLRALLRSDLDLVLPRIEGNDVGKRTPVGRHLRGLMKGPWCDRARAG